MTNPEIPLTAEVRTSRAELEKQIQRRESELWELKKHLRRRMWLSRLCLMTGLFFLGASPLLLMLGSDSWIFVLTSALYGLLFLTLAILRQPGSLRSSIHELESEIDLLEARDAPEEERTEKLFRFYESVLRKYYDQNLSQGSWIFWLGLLCIGLGFAIVLASLILVARSTALPGQIVTATLGALSGILVNYIAVIFLRMYSETVKSSNEFHNRLVKTHQMHFGSSLAAKLENSELREETLAQMALRLIQ